MARSASGAERGDRHGRAGRARRRSPGALDPAAADAGGAWPLWAPSPSPSRRPSWRSFCGREGRLRPTVRVCRPGQTTATIVRRTLIESTTVDGTLGYGSTQTVYDRLSGTYTWLPPSGVVITRGGTLFRLDELPVVLMYGAVPAYRALKRGSDGPRRRAAEHATSPPSATTPPPPYRNRPCTAGHRSRGATVAAGRGAARHRRGAARARRLRDGSPPRHGPRGRRLGQDPPAAEEPAAPRPPLRQRRRPRPTPPRPRPPRPHPQPDPPAKHPRQSRDKNPRRTKARPRGEIDAESRSPPKQNTRRNPRSAKAANRPREGERP